MYSSITKISGKKITAEVKADIKGESDVKKLKNTINLLKDKTVMVKIKAGDTKGLDKKTATLLSDFTFLLKEKLIESDDKKNYYIVKYLYNLLQSVDNVEDFKYLLGYVSKATGFTKPNEFIFDEDKQFMFEGIIHSAFTLYNSGGASKSKVIVSRDRFIQEIEERNEEKLSRTQQLNTVRIQALRELGYNEINASNAAEVFEKIAEIQSRGV